MANVALRVLRSGRLESVHRAHIAVSDARGRLVASLGDPHLVTFVRSSIKPYQAVPLVETGAADRFGLSGEELAIVCSSHNGEPRHVALVEGLLARAGLDASALRCGAHAPYHPASARALRGPPTALHNNCSGKHAGMLLACVHNEWPTESYLEPAHPLQERILAVVAEHTGVDAATIGLGVDGCSAPNFALPIRGLARAVAQLMDPERVRGERGRTLARLRDVMMTHPDLVAGTNRIDTQLMRALPGDAWVKAGGEACYGLGLRRAGLGAAVKIEDGAMRAIPPVLVRLLEELGAESTPALEAIRRDAFGPQKNWAGLDAQTFEADFRLLRPGSRLATAPPAQQAHLP